MQAVASILERVCSSPPHPMSRPLEHLEGGPYVLR